MSDSPRLPAEWEPQSAVMLTWPHGRGAWGTDITAIEADFLALATHILRYQPLLIACASRTDADRVGARLGQRDRIAFLITGADDVWARDHGPLTVLQADETPCLLDFRFDGWGGKFPSANDDRLMAHWHAAGAFGATPRQAVDWVLEGGAIDSDGAGTILTTTQCLLAPNRNGAVTAAEVERVFREHLGAQRVLWLSAGELEGDDTDGHIDMLARFAGFDALVYQQCDDPTDYHYAPLARMADQLAAMRTIDGQPYRLHALPWPRPGYAEDGHRLPLSYANFLILNDAVLVPQYDDPADAEACAVLRAAFPDREVIGTPARTLIEQHGSIHCVTMQLPAAVPLRGLGSIVQAT